MDAGNVFWREEMRLAQSIGTDKCSRCFDIHGCDGLNVPRRATTGNHSVIFHENNPGRHILLLDELLHALPEAAGQSQPWISVFNIADRGTAADNFIREEPTADRLAGTVGAEDRIHGRGMGMTDKADVRQ